MRVSRLLSSRCHVELNRPPGELPLSPTKQPDHQEYKECAGKQCRKPGIHCLKILFLNKDGWFCDSCRCSLVEANLVAEDPSIGHLGKEDSS